MGFINKFMKRLKKCNFLKKVRPYRRNNQKSSTINMDENIGDDDHIVNYRETNGKKMYKGEVKYKQSYAKGDLSNTDNLTNTDSKTQVIPMKQIKIKDDDVLSTQSKKFCSNDKVPLPCDTTSEELILFSIPSPNVEDESSVTTTLNDDLNSSCNSKFKTESYKNIDKNSISTLSIVSDQSSSLNGIPVSCASEETQFPVLSTIMPEISITQSNSHLEGNSSSSELNSIIESQTIEQSSLPESQTNSSNSILKSQTSQIDEALNLGISEIRSLLESQASELRTLIELQASELRLLIESQRFQIHLFIDLGMSEIRSLIELQTSELRSLIQSQTSEIDLTIDLGMSEIRSLIESQTSELRDSQIESQTSEQIFTFEPQMPLLSLTFDSRTPELISTSDSGISGLYLPISVPVENDRESYNGDVNHSEESFFNYRWNYQADEMLTSDLQDHIYQASSYIENFMTGDVSSFRLRRSLYSSLRGGLLQYEINMLPTRVFETSEEEKFLQIENSTDLLCVQCKICLDEYEKGQILCRLPCFHEFHELCVHTWLKNSLICPFCRTSVIET